MNIDAHYSGKGNFVISDAYLADLKHAKAIVDDASIIPHEVISQIFAGASFLKERQLEATFSEWIECASVGRFEQAETPKIVHRIWLTNPTKPSNPFERFHSSFEKFTMQGFGSNWHHIFWTNDPISLPGFGKLMSSCGASWEIRQIDTHIAQSPWQRLIERLVADQKYVSASDLLRLYVLNEIGGVYADLGFHFKENMDFLTENFEHCFVFSQQKFFQNSFIMLPPANKICKKSTI